MADCDVAFSHPTVMDEILLGSQESNLDDKSFPMEIGHLMHFFEKIVFVRPSLGVLQTDEIFSQDPSFLQKLQVHVVLSREDETRSS